MLVTVPSMFLTSDVRDYYGLNMISLITFSVTNAVYEVNHFISIFLTIKHWGIFIIHHN